MNIRGTRRLRNAVSTRVQDVVSVTRTTIEIETATRITSVTAPRKPWLVMPTSCPNHVPRGTTTSPSVMTFSVAGNTTMAVKTGMNSHTRLTKNHAGIADTAANPTARTYITSNTDGSWTNAAAISSTAIDTSFTLASITCRSPRRT